MILHYFIDMLKKQITPLIKFFLSFKYKLDVNSYIKFGPSKLHSKLKLLLFYTHLLKKHIPTFTLYYQKISPVSPYITKMYHHFQLIIQKKIENTVQEGALYLSKKI